MVTTLKPYRDKVTIRNIILDLAQKNDQVVYGQQSVNVQVPGHLTRKTKDYDIYTKNPEKAANELANKLNKEYGKTKFKVEPAVHKGTFKVKSGKTNVADYTQVRKKPNLQKILGVAYANLSYQKKKLKKIVNNKDFEYRHKKDLSTLDKIKKAEMGDFFYD